MSRSRCNLHVSRLPEFIEFCESLGWKQEDTKDYFEVLRMRHPQEAKPLIVHTRLATCRGNEPTHYTTWGIGDLLTTKFIAHRKAKEKS